MTWNTHRTVPAGAVRELLYLTQDPAQRDPPDPSLGRQLDTNVQRFAVNHVGVKLRIKFETVAYFAQKSFTSGCSIVYSNMTVGVMRNAALKHSTLPPPPRGRRSVGEG
jgi:hypothetical protein